MNPKDFIEFLKMISEYLSDPNTPTWLLVFLFVLVLIGAGFLFSAFISKVVSPLLKWISQKNQFESKKEKLLKYTGIDQTKKLREITKMYIPTRYADADSPDDEEPMAQEDDRKRPFLIQRFFDEEFSIKGRKYYLVLADCGMGKTTFLVNFYFQTLNKRKYNAFFVKASESPYLDAINKCKNKNKTVLFCDALDEIAEANSDFEDFIMNFFLQTSDFFRVIITCRTNFFSTSSEELNGTRISAPIGNTEKFEKVRKYYITPFTKKDIHIYLLKKYRYQKEKRDEANKIINNCEKLVARPMLLAYISDFVNDTNSYVTPCEIYEKLFSCWLKRESDNVNISPDVLRNNCESLAIIMYHKWQKTKQLGVNYRELDGDETLEKSLAMVKLQRHPLLNRTHDGIYKFAHKSFWEYIIASLCKDDFDLCYSIQFEEHPEIEIFLDEMYKKDNLKFAFAKAIQQMQRGLYSDAIKALNIIELDSLDINKQLFVLTEKVECFYLNLEDYTAKELIEHIESLLELNAKESYNPIYLARFLRVKGNCLRYWGFSKDSIKHLQKAINLLKGDVNDTYELLRCYLALFYTPNLPIDIKTQAEKDIDSYNAMLTDDIMAQKMYSIIRLYQSDESEDIDNWREYYRSCSMLSSFMKIQRYFEIMRKYQNNNSILDLMLSESLKICSPKPSKSIKTSLQYIYIRGLAELFERTNDTSVLAEIYYSKALAFSSNLKSKSVSYLYDLNSLGEWWWQNSNYSRALEYFEKSYNHAKYPYHKAISAHWIAQIYYHWKGKDSEDVSKWSEKAIREYFSDENLMIQVDFCNFLKFLLSSNINSSLKKEQIADELFDASALLYDMMEDRLEYLSVLIDVYKELNDSNKLKEIYTKYLAIRFSTDIAQKLRSLYNTQIEFEEKLFEIYNLFIGNSMMNNNLVKFLEYVPRNKEEANPFTSEFIKKINDSEEKRKKETQPRKFLLEKVSREGV